MVSVQSPMIDAQMDEQTRLYVGVLERQILGLTIQISKYRAVLEAVTGGTFEALEVDMEKGDIEKLAIAATQKKMDVSADQARKIVRERESAGKHRVE